MSRILITAANGFIGRALSQTLRERGHDLIPITLEEDGDIAATPLRQRDDVDCVIHLAARSFVPKSWEETADFYRVNFQGTINALEFARRIKAHFLYISTYVYGQPQYLPVDEKHPRAAVSPYHSSKILAEDACQFYAAQFEIPLAVVRPFNIYGPGQVEPWLIPSLFRQALTSAREISVADPRPRRDFLYVTDLTALLAGIVEQRATGTYNAASGTSISIGELLEHITRLSGVQKPIVNRNETRKNEIFDLRGDCSKAQRELGWTPRVAMAEGLGAVYASMKETVNS